jgi:hypothetical protein
MFLPEDSAPLNRCIVWAVWWHHWTGRKFRLQCGDEPSKELWWILNSWSNLHSKLKMATSLRIHWELIWLNRTICQMTIHFLDMMHLQRNAVFTTLHGSPQWNANLCLKTIHETEHESFDAHSDNTALVAVLLSIKHNSLARNVFAIEELSTNWNSITNICYDRIFTYGDLNTPRSVLWS